MCASSDPHTVSLVTVQLLRLLMDYLASAVSLSAAVNFKRMLIILSEAVEYVLRDWGSGQRERVQ